MRGFAVAFISLALGAIGAAPAFACYPTSLELSPKQPSVFWLAPPATIEPSEVVLEVEYEKGLSRLPLVPARVAHDDVVVVCNQDVEHIFRVKRVLRGELDAERITIVTSLEWKPYPSQPGIVVGRMGPFLGMPVMATTPYPPQAAPDNGTDYVMVFFPKFAPP